MAIVTLTAEIGCPVNETARVAANGLGYHLITEIELADAIAEEFGPIEIPAAAWTAAVQAILCRMASGHHLVLAFPGADRLFHEFPGILRVRLTASESRRIGNFMLEHGVNRPTAKRRLAAAVRKQQALMDTRFDHASPPEADITLANWVPEEAAQMIHSAAECRRLTAQGLLSGTERFEFDLRLSLAGQGISPIGQAGVKAKIFSHPSEELFANLLDFYRIPWAYEPRSFPLQWDESGAVTEAFTPDFYLPESDLYVELTAMKQSLVTKKNRKVKRLKAIYPHIQIQIFYQKDFQDLVFKHGLRARD